MKAWQQISLWTLGILACFLLLANSQGAYRQVKMDHLHLSFENRRDKSFLNIREMEAQVYKILKDSARQLSEINKAMLEESLDNHPAIRKAEVYSKIDGSLRIMLWQHEPLARVVQAKGSYYLLENGAKMPLSPHYSEEVPLISGALNEEDLKPMASFWKKLKTDRFYRNFFTGLECSKDKEWTLIPRQGRFKILLGKATGLEEKLTKLEVFYTKAPALKNINKLKEIDLRFEGQLICRKN